MGRPGGGGVSGASLRSWLPRRSIPLLQKESVGHALATPWCWPSDAALAEHAIALGHRPPTPPSVGEVLLVSVATQVARTTLWRLTWDARRHPEGRPFAPEALRAIDDVADLVTGVVPHLHSLRMLADKPRAAIQVLKRGPHSDQALEGPSFGLSMLLALCSRLMDRPVPARFAASAVVRSDGSLGPVEGLDRKLSLLSEGALGVDTVIVAAEQLAQARRILDEHPWLRAVGAATAREAVDLVFEGAREAPPPAWSERRPLRAVDELLALCTRGGEVREWRAVERSAAWLQQLFDGVPYQGERARFARQVAERHANGRGFEIPWDESIDATHDRGRAAHVVQAAADAGSASLTAYLDRARALLLDPPEDDDLRLRGAIGRGLSAMRSYRQASIVLGEATHAWIDRENPDECSRPRAVWVRVAGRSEVRAPWEGASKHASDYLLASPSSAIGALFVRYALGRGLCTLGLAAEALATLDGVEWSAAPAWLARSRARWRARCLRALGRAEECRMERAAIAEAVDDDGTTPIEVHFVALDEALDGDGEPDAAVGAVRAASPQGVGWLFDGTLTPQEQARRLADEYPY